MERKGTFKLYLLEKKELELPKLFPGQPVSSESPHREALAGKALILLLRPSLQNNQNRRTSPMQMLEIPSTLESVLRHSQPVLNLVDSAKHVYGFLSLCVVGDHLSAICHSPLRSSEHERYRRRCSMPTYYNRCSYQDWDRGEESFCKFPIRRKIH